MCMMPAGTAQQQNLTFSSHVNVHLLITSKLAEAFLTDLGNLRRSGQLIFTLSNWMADPKCTSEIRHRWLDIWEQVWLSL